MEEQSVSMGDGMNVDQIITTVGSAVDVGGVIVIVVGIIIATVRFLLQSQRGESGADTFKNYRQGLGQALLLGLEVLIAADIIRTIAIPTDFLQIGILAAIVVIRTFLSWSLEVELEGRWPWQQGSAAESGTLGHDPAATTHSKADTAR